MSKPFQALGMKRVLTHVGVGMGAASFWRGAWYVLDDHLFPDDKGKSALASFGLGVAGMTASQGLVAKCEELASRKSSNSRSALVAARRLQMFRFGALYTIAVSCVLVWRGTWVGWDVLYEYTHPAQTPCRTGVKSTDPGHLSTSGMLSHVIAITALVGTGLFASVLAPPAATSIVRDWAVQAGAKPYSGPAGKLVQRLWAKTSHIPSWSAVQPVMARSSSSQPQPRSVTLGRTFLTQSSSRPLSYDQRRGL